MLTLAAQTGIAEAVEATGLVALGRFIPLWPLLGMIACGLLGCVKSHRVRNASAVVAIATVGLSFVFSVLVAIGYDGTPAIAYALTWIHIGDFAVDFSFYIDPLTIVMLMVVTGIGTLITIYATGYMAGDEGYFRFFAYICLFILAMSLLVLADNLVLLYLGWEGVGLASYLLIGFYYRKPSAAAAAKKAFIVNRIGDFGFALGVMGVFLVFGAVQYSEILPAAQALSEHVTVAGGESAYESLDAAVAHAGFLAEPWTMVILAIPFLLMLGAFGKSAQLPLHVWLPDAMEGPTPVSALIHAATMVTAGVYMIARLLPIFELSPYALPTVAVIGGVTALFAATIALCQFDIKRIWAYSTVSQLGYMFLGVGVLSTFGGIFHLFTHAFFKALLFLTAGSVMHALAGQLDLRKMSGLIKKMPITGWLMFAGCLALAGFPFTAGFYSKDQILYQAINTYPVLGWLGLATALLTAFYTFRLWFRVFLGPEKYEMGDEHHGYSPTHHPWVFREGAGHAVEAHGSRPPDAEMISAAEAQHAPAHVEADHGAHAHHHHHEPHEMNWLMNGPLVVLAIGAIAAGFMFHDWMEHSIEQSTAAVAQAHHGAAAEGAYDQAAAHAGSTRPVMRHKGDPGYISHGLMGVMSGGGAILMILLAGLLFWKKRGLAANIASKFGPIVTLLNRKYYVDELYLYGIVKPLRFVGWTCYQLIDRILLDAALFDGLLGRGPRVAADGQAATTRGRLQGYALMMGLGLLIVVGVVMYAMVV